MVFSSLFFLYAFLPLSLLAYFLCSSLKAKNICLLASSLVFYSWGEPKYVLLLMLMTLCNWYFALRIERLDANDRKGRSLWAVFTCIVDLGLIGFFKYGRMFCSVFGPPPDFVANITLPLGISFYTFQLLSYVVDVKRGEVDAQEKYWHLLLFASLFHQCIAGPIVRYKTIAAELFEGRDGREGLPGGCVRFCVGLAKKVLLANACGALADMLLLSETALSDGALVSANLSALGGESVLGLWVGLLGYTLQVYFDFSAYSDMAIGMGRMLGLTYQENFNYPYTANSITEYWRRWHISLSSFFRDYVYIPLGGNRRGDGRTVLNMLIVWSLTGLWHGANWSFVIWGMYFGVLLIIERFVLKSVLKHIPSFIRVIVTLFLVMLSWVIFRFDSLDYMLAVFRGLFGLNGNPLTSFQTSTVLKNNMFLLPFCILAATPLIKNAALWVKGRLDGNHSTAALSGALSYGVVPVVLLLLSTAALVGSSYNPFLYYRF